MSFFYFLSIGTTFAFFHSHGEKPRVRQDLKIILWGLQMDLSHNLSTQMLIISSLWVLFESSFLIMFLISSERFFCDQTKEWRYVLQLSINEHSFTKNVSLFSLKSMKKLLSWKSGSIREFFYHLKGSLITSNSI